jgi:predicted DCC family thiol-disulfide oxidoreductase YuxK
MSADASGAPAAPAELGFDPKVTWIVYDGECPFCTQYVKLMRLRETVGIVKPLNAREDHPSFAMFAPGASTSTRRWRW